MKVRRAVASDISALYAMLKEMHGNTKLEVAPIDDYKLLNKIHEVIHKGLVLVSYKDNQITGSIAGTTTSDWWSSEPLLADMWFYVSPKHRNSIIAIKLVKSFIKIAKEVNIAVKLGHVYSGDIERKDNFFKRLGLTKAGSLYTEVR